MRYLAVFLAILAMSGCVGSGPAYEEPLPRDIYQKLNLSSYAGAGTGSGDTLTARGTRYQRGAISSAAASSRLWSAPSR